MVNTLAALLVFQCLGETTAFALDLPVPGPVIGMLLLLTGLRISRPLRQAVEDTSLALLKHLSLLFVPAGVGIVVYADRVYADLAAIAVTIVVGTALTVISTALTAKALCRIDRRRIRVLESGALNSTAATSSKPHAAPDAGEPR
jgi:holin-like protein